MANIIRVVRVKCPLLVRLLLFSSLGFCLIKLGTEMLTVSKNRRECENCEGKRRISEFSELPSLHVVPDHFNDQSTKNTATKNTATKNTACRLSVPTPLVTSDTLTDLTNWDFKTTVKCPYIDVNRTASRQKAILDCSSTAAIKYVKTNNFSDVFQVEFGDVCLGKVIKQCCSDDKPVPNVIHYINYGNHSLGYFQFLSYMSVLRFMKPCLFLIHGDFTPSGTLWNYFVSIYPNVVHVKRALVKEIYGHKLAHKEHGADVMRIQAIQTYGGAYIDWDQLFLRPIEPLRKYDYVQAQAGRAHFTNGVIIGKKNATFLHLWLQGYKNYTSSWGGNSLFYPFQLAKRFPELIHVEGFNFTRPIASQMGLIFNKNYDWSTNYAMHLYIRYYKRKTDMEIIRTLNTTIGAVSRHVLFGNKELCRT